MNGLTFYYDYVTTFKTQTTGTDKTMNINVNIPRRSMKVFFQEAADAREYDSECTPFQNPDITDIQVTIEGLANKVPLAKKIFIFEDSFRLILSKFPLFTHLTFRLEIK
jgi:hypothetical protein